MKVKIKFVDFWPDFDDDDNFFTDILADKFELSDTPEILFFSNFGKAHLNYNCFKVFFSSENERPNFLETDIAMTFDLNSNPRHFRLPLYLFYMRKYKLALNESKLGIKSIFLNDWEKRKFCCMVVSNEKSKMRNSFFDFLSNKERIDSGGKYLNNVNGPVIDKIEFIKNYKFVISFENSCFNGYTTEKILEPFIANCIPVYWGNNLVKLDFNPDSYLFVKGKRDFERIYAQMKYLEKNIEQALKIVNSDKIYLQNEFYNSTKIREFILKNYYKNGIKVSEIKLYKILNLFLSILKTLKYWVVKFTFGHYR